MSPSFKKSRSGPIHDHYPGSFHVVFLHDIIWGCVASFLKRLRRSPEEDGADPLESGFTIDLPVMGHTGERARDLRLLGLFYPRMRRVFTV